VENPQLEIMQITEWDYCQRNLLTWFRIGKLGQLGACWLQEILWKI